MEVLTWKTSPKRSLRFCDKETFPNTRRQESSGYPVYWLPWVFLTSLSPTHPEQINTTGIMTHWKMCLLFGQRGANAGVTLRLSLHAPAFASTTLSLKEAAGLPKFTRR